MDSNSMLKMGKENVSKGCLTLHKRDFSPVGMKSV